MPSFHVVSKLDHQGFKGGDASIEKTDEELVIEAGSEHHVTTELVVLREKLAK